MKTKRVAILTLVLLVLCLPRASGIMLKYEKGYSITNFVEDSDLVVYGWVVEKEFVSRPPNGCTTDITIEVIETIKGTPNSGADRVRLMIAGGECGGYLSSIVEDTPEFKLGEGGLFFLKKDTQPWLHIPHGGYSIFRAGEGKLPIIGGGQVLIWYTLDNDVEKSINLPVDLVIQIAKAAAKNPQATRQLEEDIKAHILLSEKFTDRLKREAKAIQEADPPPTTEEMVIQFANTIVGLDRLADVRIKAAAFMLPENDDTPILSVKKRLLDSRHLWKVSYQVDVLAHKNKVNPHIVGFDVYVDIAEGQVLKIISRDVEGLAEEFRKGIEVSNQQIRYRQRYNQYIQWNLPAVAPAFTLGDFLVGSGKICRHYECYYILCRTHNGDKAVPRWLLILYGTEPIQGSGGIEMAYPPEQRTFPKPRTLADGYVRTFEIHFVDAMSGERLPFAYITGKNTDIFR